MLSLNRFLIAIALLSTLSFMPAVGQELDAQLMGRLSRLEQETFSRDYAKQPLARRIIRMEQRVFGSVMEGPFAGRIQQLDAAMEHKGDSGAKSEGVQTTLEDNSLPKTADTQAEEPEQEDTAPDDNRTHFEKYPFVKWRAQKVGGLPGGGMKMETTLGYQGYIKYQVTLFQTGKLKKVFGKFHSDSDGVLIDFLDSRGFKLGSFTVTGFRESTGLSNAWEAKGDAICDEYTYKTWKKYSAVYQKDVPSPRSRGTFRQF